VNVLGLIASVLIGVSLGFFGGGGSILSVPLLVYAFGLPPKEAIASSLLVVATASGVAAIQHARAGNLRPRVAATFGLAGMVGAYVGARVAAFIDGGILLLLFAAVMALTALAMWRGRRGVIANTGRPEGSRRKLVLQGLTVGLFTGLVGAGGGFLIVPALALWTGLTMKAAIGTSLLVIVLNCLAGFAGYAAHVEIQVPLVTGVSACAIAGSFAGSGLVRRVQPDKLRPAFAGFILVMAGMILVREGQLLLTTGADALPRNLPQLVFVLAMLAVGVIMGRASRGSGAADIAAVEFEEGAGI
jgi:uncharacterized membrane protein YfcA